MPRKAKHSHNRTDMDWCDKCGRSGLQQVMRPYVRCRPELSKRRMKKIADRTPELPGDAPGQWVLCKELVGDGPWKWVSIDYRFVPNAA